MNPYTWKGRKVFPTVILLAIFSAGFSPLGVQALSEKSTLRQLVDEAEYIVVATCIGQSTHFDASGSRVFTISRFDVNQVVAGEPPITDISLRVIGGDRDGLQVNVPGAPRFGQGRKYLLFVTREFENGFRTTVGWQQGVMEVMKPSANEPELVVSSPGMAEVFDRELKTMRGHEKPNISGLKLEEALAVLQREAAAHKNERKQPKTGETAVRGGK